MNIPLPGILTQESLPVVAKYISVPEYSDPCILKGAPAVREPRIMVTTGARSSARQNLVQVGGWTENTGSQRSLYGQVIALQITNNNSTSSAVEINPNLLTAANFGNVAGVTIVNQGGNATYGQILSALRDLPIQIGMLRAQMISGSNSLFSDFQILISEVDAFGGQMTRPHNFRISPFQQQIDIVELPVRGGRLSANSKIHFALPAHTTIILNIYPEAQPNVNMVNPFQNERFSGVDGFGSDGFSPVDNSAGFPEEDTRPEDPNLDEDLERYLDGSTGFLSRLSQRRAAKLELRNQRKQSKIDARIARKEAKIQQFHWREREFEQKAQAEFNSRELKKIEKLKTEDLIKYRHLVLNYNFDGFSSNLGDFL